VRQKRSRSVEEEPSYQGEVVPHDVGMALPSSRPGGDAGMMTGAGRRVKATS